MPIELSNFELATHFMHEVWEKGNEDAIFREFEGVATGLWPDEDGIDPHGFLQYHRALKPLINGLTFEFTKHQEQGDHLWVSWIVHGKHWKKSEKLIRWPGAATARYRDGKMVECNNHHDFLILFSQLNLVPEQAFEYGLAGADILELEERRKEELPPSAKGQSHFLWPGLRRVNSSGREIYLPCSTRQISSADSAQQFILPDEEQLEVLFESTAFAMVVVDHTDAILEADESFSELVDRMPESLPGVLFHQIVLPEDRAGELALFAELMDGKRLHYRHRVRLMRGRTVVWVQVAVARIPRSEGGFRIVRAIEESSRIEEFVEFQETERKMISMELHDGLAQEIATLWIYLQTGKHQAEPSPLLMERCLNVVERMSQDIRSQMMDLRSPVLEGTLLSEALESLAHRITREKGLAISLNLGQELDQAEHTVGLLVYRVVQEALRNVIAHSGAKECRVELARKGSELIGSIIDSGCGFDVLAAAKKGRLGIRGMRDRCELVSGSLSVSSELGLGAKILFTLPWSPRIGDS